MSALIEDLQYTLAERPCVDAYDHNRPVTEPDLSDPTVSRWAAFSPPALHAGAKAVFGFPLQVGHERLGARSIGGPRRLNSQAAGRPGKADMLTDTRLVKTLVELADTLVDDFDVVELLTRLSDRCVELLDVSAAGLMLVSPEDDLKVVASSSEAMRVVELFELQAQQGPCLDCYRSGDAVWQRDLVDSGDRWPLFAPVAVEAGFRSVHAVPMRQRGRIIGALNLFGAEPGELDESDGVAARALADVATIAILQHRAVKEAQVLNEQLSYALSNRVIIEQAKGVLAERLGLAMEQSFATLRNHARSHNLRLAGVASSIIDGSLAVAELELPEAPVRA